MKKEKEHSEIYMSLKLKYPERSRIKYPVYLSEDLNQASFEQLGLSNRATNALKRSGYNNIGDVVRSISCSEDLMHNRGMGATTIDEIFERILVFQYSLIPEDKKASFLKRIEELNA